MLSRVVWFLLLGLLLLLNADNADAERDGVPGRRVGGGTRYAPHKFESSSLISLLAQ